MPGPWKPWKTRQRFPTAPTAPWKSHTPRFPPSHSADGFPLSSQEKQTPRPSRSSDAQGRDQTAERRPLAASASAANRPLFQAHSALERKPLFRLIARWNQFAISGSFVDWKMLPDRGCHAVRLRGYAGRSRPIWVTEARPRAATPAPSGFPEIQTHCRPTRRAPRSAVTTLWLLPVFRIPRTTTPAVR